MDVPILLSLLLLRVRHHEHMEDTDSSYRLLIKV